MKRCVVVMLAALFAFGLIMKPSVSHAVEAKVGITMMGDWWQPAFINFENESAAKLFGSNLKDNSDGSFMFGPMFWVNVASNWNIGGQMLFGLSRNHFEYSTIAIDLALLRPYFPVPGGYYDIGESDCRRYDLDLNAEYGFHKYFDLLIGVRFNYDDGEGDSFRLYPSAPFLDFKKEEYNAWYFGPSLGVKFHYELIKDLTLSAAAAFTFQFGEYYNEKKFLQTFIFFVPYEYTAGYVAMGLDMNVKLAYYIAPAHLEVFLGGRYQFLGHIAASDDSSVLDLTYKNGWIGGEIEHWGGIFFGAAYKF